MAFAISQFEAKLTQANPNISRLKESSVEPLLKVLRTLPSFGGITPNKKAEIQQAYAFIPLDKQQKYKAAFDYMKSEIAAFADAIPVKPVMKLLRFETNIGEYFGINASGAKKRIPLPTRSYHHICEFSYSSSNGSMQSLAKVGTRENVTYRTAPDGPPFNHTQSATPIHFTQGATTNNGAASGSCTDDHSTLIPSLICVDPRKAGSLVAEQWYEYTTDGVNWLHIPGAAYLLEKSVKPGGPTGWLYVFKKTNWMPHNMVPFKLEVEYKIDPAPEYKVEPGTQVSKSLNSPADIKKFAFKVVSLR